MIGASHEVCEDYAASLNGFAALADGCSIVTGEDGSRINAHTDIGARLLVRAAFHHRHECKIAMQHRLILNTADGYRRQLDLPIETLSATLLTLRHDGDWVYATCCGDGLIAARLLNGEWRTFQFVYPSRPYYLRYHLDSQANPELPVRIFCFDERRADNYVSGLQFSVAEYDLVIAMSDGSSSFTKANQLVPFDREFVTRLFDFRRMKGRFVLRHLRGVLKELDQDGITNQDDISMIAIHKE